MIDYHMFRSSTKLTRTRGKSIEYATERTHKRRYEDQHGSQLPACTVDLEVQRAADIGWPQHSYGRIRSPGKTLTAERSEAATGSQETQLHNHESWDLLGRLVRSSPGSLSSLHRS